MARRGSSTTKVFEALKGSAFLFLILFGRFHHLVVRGFFQSAGDELLPQTLILIETGAGGPVTGFARHAIAIAHRIDDPIGVIRGSNYLGPRNLPARLIPIRIRVIVRLAFVDESNLTRASFDQLRRGGADSIAVHGNLAEGRMGILIHKR